jgi:hypothetical protein
MPVNLQQLARNAALRCTLPEPASLPFGLFATPGRAAAGATAIMRACFFHSGSGLQLRPALTLNSNVFIFQRRRSTQTGIGGCPRRKGARKRMHWSLRILLGLFGTVLGLVVMVLLGVTFIVALTYPKLPDLER